ncbi:MAG: DUF1501 domain-containing protein [Gammaproteobacteria bacterium]
MKRSRRAFLKSGLGAALLGLSPGLLRLAIPEAAAAASDYRAAVCIFLHGGNDANNCVVALDDTGYRDYQTARGGLTLPMGSLWPIQTRDSQRSYGLHPEFRGLHDLYTRGRLAVLANVGTLNAPLTRQEFLAHTGAKPQKLFSHSDQSSQWQSPRASRTTREAVGWGGLMADALAPHNGAAQFPGITTLAESSLYCEGMVTRPAAVHPTSLNGLYGFSANPTHAVRRQALHRLTGATTGHALIDTAAAQARRMLEQIDVLESVMAAYPELQTPFPETDLGRQLRRAAQLIQARDGLGLNRQLLFVSLGGFDTHKNQLSKQAALLAQLDAAMTAFYWATEELGVASQVLSFTLSEFSRSVSPTGHGSDHGWGSHHFILGGGVRGGDVYGTFPHLELGGPDDAGDKGRLIPTTAVDQYAATIAAWMGVGAGDIAGMFPNLANFTQRRLAFV